MWENMSTSKVDQRYRIVVDKQIREKTNIRAGDVVVLEPLDEHSFRVTVMDFSEEKFEDDPAWKAIRTPVKAEKYIPPKKLEKILEEEVWLE